jgi:hypothetical protein
MAEKRKETYSPNVIFAKGSVIQKAIYERTQKLQRLNEDLLLEISAKIREACVGDEDPVEKAAGLLVALENDYGLGAHAMSIKAFIRRASEVQNELRELTRFGRCLMQDAAYELSWDDADRFGL